jgi:hypothetical protein
MIMDLLLLLETFSFLRGNGMSRMLDFCAWQYEGGAVAFGSKSYRISVIP